MSHEQLQSRLRLWQPELIQAVQRTARVHVRVQETTLRETLDHEAQMTRDEFNAAMQKILIFYQRPTSPDHIEDFRLNMNGLYVAMYPMEADLVDKTCTQ